MEIRRPPKDRRHHSKARPRFVVQTCLATGIMMLLVWLLFSTMRHFSREEAGHQRPTGHGRFLNPVETLAPEADLASDTFEQPPPPPPPPQRLRSPKPEYASKGAPSSRESSHRAHDAPPHRPAAPAPAAANGGRSAIESAADGTQSAQSEHSSHGWRFPGDFSVKAYLKWNVDVKMAGIHNSAAAREHYTTVGHTESRIYKEFNLTLRYTACGGVFEQHYSHLHALFLARLVGATHVIWPALQERESYAKSSSRKRSQRQSWKHMDAKSVWDLDAMEPVFKDKYEINLLQAPTDCPMPDTSAPATAFQLCDIPPHAYDVHTRITQPIYRATMWSTQLIRYVHDAVRAGAAHLGRHPTSVLLDLPCTLYMADVRGHNAVEDLAQSIKWAPRMVALADTVMAGVKRATKWPIFQAVHLRLELDASAWARESGGTQLLWENYKHAMERASFNDAIISPTMPLYVGSGLLQAKESAESKRRFALIAKELLEQKYGSHIVHKELFLSTEELAALSNEQAAVVDYLVMENSNKAVGLGVSALSFYLSEMRMIQGFDPDDTQLLMMPHLGMDKTLYMSALVATETRKQLKKKHRLRDLCLMPNREFCFPDKDEAHGYKSSSKERAESLVDTFNSKLSEGAITITDIAATDMPADEAHML